MLKGGNKLARDGIPKLRGVVLTRCNNPSAVGAKRCVVNPVPMGIGYDKLARRRVSKLGSLVPTRR